MVDHTWIGGVAPRVPMEKALATLDQAAPVQNTWYTVLDTSNNVRIIGLAVLVAVADETLACRITVDGQTITGTVAATAAHHYSVTLLQSSTSTTLSFSDVAVTDVGAYRAFLLEGRSVKVEVRKTTALGAGNLTAAVHYQQW